MNRLISFVHRARDIAPTLALAESSLAHRVTRGPLPLNICGAPPVWTSAQLISLALDSLSPQLSSLLSPDSIVSRSAQHTRFELRQERCSLVNSSHCSSHCLRNMNTHTHALSAHLQSVLHHYAPCACIYTLCFVQAATGCNSHHWNASRMVPGVTAVASNTRASVTRMHQ